MKTVRKLSLSNIKISLVSRHADSDFSYFLKVGVGSCLQRSDNRKKHAHSSFYEYGSLEIEWEPHAAALQIDFMRNASGLPEVVGESEVLIDNLLSSSMEQLKLVSVWYSRSRSSVTSTRWAGSISRCSSRRSPVRKNSNGST